MGSVWKLTASAPTKSFIINPLSTSVVKECLDEVSPTISSSVNLSLEQGHFPDAWKGALFKPKLKKSGLELDEKKYRPVSNLQFLSKLAEKAVAQQEVSRVTACGLFPKLRSAYRQFHSTETASLRVHNDILLKMNKQDISLLVFLDLNSAFDMIDHMVLLRRLEDKFVFCRTALEFVPVRQIPAGCNRRCNF